MSSNTGHPGTTESIQHHIPWFGVVKDQRYNSQMWHLCVVRVRLVNRIGLSLANIHSKRFPAVGHIRIIGSAILRYKILNERIRAGGIIRRIGQCQDVLVLANGESLDLAELRVLELLAQFPPGNTPGVSRRFRRSCPDIPPAPAAWRKAPGRIDSVHRSCQSFSSPF